MVESNTTQRGARLFDALISRALLIVQPPGLTNNVQCPYLLLISLHSRQQHGKTACKQRWYDLYSSRTRMLVGGAQCGLTAVPTFPVLASLD